MTEKERFSFLSRCITLQSLQSLKNEQLRMLTDDFKEPEVRHILITQANASAVKTDRVLVSVQRDALDHICDVWAGRIKGQVPDSLDIKIEFNERIRDLSL